ncbi:MAG: hypothetical protein M3P22_00785 [bacterium]|nr:hypothetical protein [bacterium]
MIYLFFGDDSKKKILAHEELTNSLLKDNEFFIFSKKDFDKIQIENLYSSNNLFFTKYTVVFLDISENTEMMDFLLYNLPQMAQSTNNFIFLEGKLNKNTVDMFKKVRTEINVFELPKEKKEKYNSFLLANAIGDKNKFNLWLSFRQARDAGVAMEELIGILFWKVKDMILKKNFTKWKNEELQILVNKIPYILPEARRDGKDDEACFEQFILEIF